MREHTKATTILVLATTFPRYEDDEIPQFVFEISQQLDDDRTEVLVLAPHDPGAKLRETMSGLLVYRYPYFLPFRFQKLVFQGGVLPTVKKSPLAAIQVPFLLMSLLIYALWIVRSKDVDVVHSHWVVPNGFVGSIVSSLFGVSHILTLHAAGVHGLGSLPANGHISRFVYCRSDAIVPVSTTVKEKFADQVALNGCLDEGRFVIQPMGAHIGDYDVDRKQTLREVYGVDDEVVGLFVGRLADKKGLTYLIDAVEELRSRHDRFRILIVGRGYMEEEFREYASERGVADIVEFTGWVSEEELHERYVLSDFFVLPSIKMSDGDTEGMPTVIPEAFAAANPVIASDVGGIADVVEDGENGLLVEQKRTDQLAEAIETMLTDEAERERMGKRAMETAKLLDWTHCGRTYAKIIEDSVGGGRFEDSTDNDRFREMDSGEETEGDNSTVETIPDDAITDDSSGRDHAKSGEHS